MKAFLAPSSFFFALLICAVPFSVVAEESQVPLSEEVVADVPAEVAPTTESIEQASSTESAAEITPQETSPQDAASTTEAASIPVAEDSVSISTPSTPNQEDEESPVEDVPAPEAVISS